MFICQYCKKESKNSNSHKNHEARCPANKTRKYKNGMTGKRAWNKGLTKETSESVRTQAEVLSARFKNGELEIKGSCTKEYRQTDAFKSQCSRGGGYRKNAGSSKKFRVNDSFGTAVCLQSSYELLCSEILNELGINWIRPKHLRYVLDGKCKKYFPDFYLVDYDIYLDPKNDYLASKDAKKIESVIQENKVSVFILTKEKITKEFIKTMVGSSNGKRLD